METKIGSHDACGRNYCYINEMRYVVIGAIRNEKIPQCKTKDNSPSYSHSSSSFSNEFTGDD